MMKITKEESRTCLICGKKFLSSLKRTYHVKKEHGLNFESYIMQIYYNNKYPLCKCGCGTKLSFKGNKRGPFFAEYTKNHFPRKPHSKKTKTLIKKRTVEAIREKFGVDNVFILETIKNKSKQTKLKKYNDENYNNIKKNRTNQFKKFYKLLFETNRLQNKVIPLFKLEEYNGIDKQYKFQCKKCNNIFYDNLDNGKVPRCLNCYPYLIEYSELEKEIFNYIKTIYNGTIIENGRKILHGLELDIYIPDKKLAIEFDGLYWHSQLNGKNKNYHLNKTKLCEDQGIQLIHIFEDEWLNKQDIVKSRLQHILGQNSNLIFARNCKIREITPIEKRHFLDQYHIQGNDNSAIKFGLFNGRELIAVMTFGKRRLALGKKSSEEGEFELLRFATSKSVIGGAGKLLKHFIRNYNPTKIISYADRRWTYKENNLYEKIGFEKAGETPVNYWYIKETTRIHRFNFRKNVLNEKLKNFDPQLTEWQNMQLNKYDRIWDCGSLKYEMEI